MIKYQELEKKVMEALLSGESDTLFLLRQQYEKSRVIEVDETGCGVFFSYHCDEVGLKKFKNDFQFGDVLVNTPDTRLPVGSILFIKNGYIDTLELFAYDEWSDFSDGYTVIYDSDTRDLSMVENQVIV